jgi:hypothetical protein
METTASLTSKVLTTVKEYWWTVDVKYECYSRLKSQLQDQVLNQYHRIDFFVPVLALFEDPNPCSTINQTVDDHQDLPQTALSQKTSASSEADLSLLPRNKSLPLATIPRT